MSRRDELRCTVYRFIHSTRPGEQGAGRQRHARLLQRQAQPPHGHRARSGERHGTGATRPGFRGS
jgi:hypothetical protein